MPGVPRELTKHSLKVKKDANPVKQGLRCLETEKRKAVGKEILRLSAAKFIKEVVHTEWLANPFIILLDIFTNFYLFYNLTLDGKRSFV